MLTDNSIKVLKARYLREGETPDDMFMRVANCVAGNCPDKQAEYFTMMHNLEFLPNSPTLMNAGRELGQLSACFVLPIEDNTISIFDAIKNAAIIHKSGGGTGFSFSRIRQRGSEVRSSKGVASGPVSFLKVFNAATECIKQGGTRRGANMGILRVDHPDILDFINCKSNNKDITNFNLSIAITEKFMEAYFAGKEYQLIDPVTNKPMGDLSATMVFDLICECAYKNGEPGIVFIDEMNLANPTPWLGDIESTNPCGEQPLLPWEACNLGSINLARMLKKHGKTRIYQVDYAKLDRIVRTSVNFLDDVIDANNYPLPEIEEKTKATRKIGLGVMGFADALIMMGLRYDTQDAIDEAGAIMRFINKIARDESIKIAEKKGVYPAAKNLAFVVERNATRTTIAPTGTLSIIANVSSGIEPIFAIAFERDQAGLKMLDVHPLFKKMLAERNIPLSIAMIKEIMKNGIHDMDIIPADIKILFVTAHDILPEWHVRMQAVFQRNTDNAVSKTVNMSISATMFDVKRVFIEAYKSKCKGVTIYRDGSREDQTLQTGASYNKEVKTMTFDEAVGIPATLQVNTPRERPDVTSGITEKFKTGCGNLYVTINGDDDGICEVFTNTGRAGGCPSQSEATSRLASVLLRANVDPKSVVDQLKGIRCPSTIKQKDMKCTSCPDAIGRLLEKAILDKNTSPIVLNESAVGCKKLEPIVLNVCAVGSEAFMMDDDKLNCGVCGEKEKCDKSVNKNRCSECGYTMENESGCRICKNCGNSRCG